jgi:enoyl-CoA hydratase
MEGLTFKQEGRVVQVTLDQPPVNALSRDLVQGLWEALDAVEALPEVAVLHLRATGRCFCAGADLAEMREAFSGTTQARQAQRDYVQRLQRLFRRLERLPVVSVAEIGGHALGGGLELALACDLRLGAKDARLGLPEVDLGLLPGAGGTQRMTRICGQSTAKRLILGAEVVAGEEAEALGLLHWAVPREALDEAARKQVNRLSALPPAALAAAKQCIDLAAWSDHRGEEAELSATEQLMKDATTQRLVADFLSQSR